MRILIALALIALTGGCSVVDNFNADRYYEAYKYECLGQKKTANCLNLRVKHNIAGLKAGIAAIESVRSTSFKNLSDDEFKAGIDALKLLIELEEADRPNFFSRWFLGSLPPFTSPKLDYYIIHGYQIRDIFLRAAEEARVKNGGNAGEIYEERTATLGSLEQNRMNGHDGISTGTEGSSIEETEPMKPLTEATQQTSSLDASSNIKASFDCTKASSSVEIMICGNDELAALDNELAETYANSLRCTQDPVTVKKSQREWITNERDVCQDSGCVNSAMNRQLTQLRSMCN